MVSHGSPLVRALAFLIDKVSPHQALNLSKEEARGLAVGFNLRLDSSEMGLSLFEEDILDAASYIIL
ncbi:TPA_asm: hypothetical protein [ssRNA phage Zoerhiza.4_24]|uniref:Uncharacterized protein n=2 Tax=Leviviricetes TaxID=2842243 RepID=A0A8S5KYD5_9VIRU|nr:hypothetical protein QIR07_gp4 [ssRNA phage Zoerhiza.4_24]QDH89967.1 MAG: hypothetical protein H4Rhizo45414_000004 [Leviviridae sp.]DAD50433.1 TPA_asm: hypothetical protein [ssRNA phage Zoerhiza.4_24]